MRYAVLAAVILLALTAAALLAGWTWDEDTARVIAEGSLIIA